MASEGDKFPVLSMVEIELKSIQQDSGYMLNPS